MAGVALVTGASGLLGRQVLKTFKFDDWEVHGTALNRINPPEIIKLDLLRGEAIRDVMDQVKPNVVIHCAANRFPDSCAANPAAANQLNVHASRALAEACIASGSFLIYISTDYVFSGRPGEAPYAPDAPTAPPNVYGQTKLDGEKAVLDVASKHGIKNKIVVLRVPILYGSCDDPAESAVNVLLSQLWAAQKLQPGEPKIKVDDYAQRYPTNTADVARVCEHICSYYKEHRDHDLPEVLHFSSEDRMTKWDIVKTFSDIMDLPLDGMEPFRPDADPTDGVQRPYDCHLDTGVLKALGIDISTVDFRTWWRREVGAFRH